MTDETPPPPDAEVTGYNQGKIVPLTADNDELGELIFGALWSDFKATLAAVKDSTTVSIRVVKN